MHKELEMIISSLVKDRISNIPSPELKIDLFINVESRQEIPDFFRNIFLTMVTEALDELVSKTEVNYNDKIYYTSFLFILDPKYTQMGSACRE